MSGISIENWEVIQGWENKNFSSKNVMEVRAGTLGAANLNNSTKPQARLTCPFYSKEELAHIFIVLHEHPTQPVHKWLSGGQSPATIKTTLSHWKPAGAWLLRPPSVGYLWQKTFCVLLLSAATWESLLPHTHQAPSLLYGYYPPNEQSTPKFSSQTPHFGVIQIKKGQAWLWRKHCFSPIIEFLNLQQCAL